MNALSTNDHAWRDKCMICKNLETLDARWNEVVGKLETLKNFGWPPNREVSM